MKYLKLIVLLLVLTSSTCKSEHPDLTDGLYAIIHTSYGEILLQLEFEKAPMTVANFVSLAKGTNTYVDKKFKGKPFYDGLKFHRVLKNFMVQGGDPKGTGQGGPGYVFIDEFNSDLKHDKAGILSMANGGPDGNGSQFFITHKATPWLDNRHSVFGHVVKGQEIVDVIKKGDIIEKIEIIQVGKEAKSFKAAKVFDTGFKELEEKAKKEKEAQAAAIKNILDKEEKATEYPSGLKIYFEKEGEGKQPKVGQKVKMHYTGYLRDGKVFDSSLKKNKPFETAIGVGRVIQGWDEGVVKLKEGGKAILYIPAHLAYGERGAGRAIPPNADIIFEVELLEVLK